MVKWAGNLQKTARRLGVTVLWGRAYAQIVSNVDGRHVYEEERDS
jgi:hypothetical protein